MGRFKVHYIITCYEEEAIDEKLRWICLEQSVELPESVVSKRILEKVEGKVEEVEERSPGKYRVSISWPLENIGGDRTQFLNILYGNISLKRGIKIISVDWDKLNDLFKGPMYGIHGIRELMAKLDRPLSCGVLKPMGSSIDDLVKEAREFALGGIDMIKDDHGLANQNYAPFEKRVEKISETLKSIYNETGQLTHYYPNITVSGSQIMKKYEDAAELGASGVLVIPHLCGYEVMHELAQYELDLPIIAHPAFSGALVTDPDHGFTPAFLYGEVYRAFGADYAVYPNTGGRFSFSVDECNDLNESARSLYSPFKRMFPMPGGGMKRETIARWAKEYGKDTVFLLGASMFQHPEGIRKASEEVQEILRMTKA